MAEPGKICVRSGQGEATTLCGARIVERTTVSRAFGYWGPEGAGWEDICADCKAAGRKAVKRG